MTPEQWSRVRTYEPSGSFDNPDPELPMPETPYQLKLRQRIWSGLLWGSGAVLFVLLVLVVTADSR